jgi:RNA polymerase-interacting CarD/CdnL/TRCF family regulator
METQVATQSFPSEFLPGSSVIYAMHGRCTILSVEARHLGNQEIRFYKLEVKKNSPSRLSRNETAIWVPVEKARAQGLRIPMDKAEAMAAMKLLLAREYFLKINEPWSILQSKLESMIRTEGGLGLAKAASFLYVFIRKQMVPAPEVLKFQEAIVKLLLRELSEALEEPIKVLDEKLNKGMKVKLLPDV